MGGISRVLPTAAVTTLDDHIGSRGGGRGLDLARKLGQAGVLDEVEASGLRGRGGAGFPTGVKWRTVAQLASPTIPTTVVVNGAEGEPGTFKDRTLLRANPYAVVEGALIAALAVGADRAVVALKASFEDERRLLDRAIAEIAAAGWSEGVAVATATGPSEYLFGEETGLLEVLDGRPPFPRVAPPYRSGVDEPGPAGAPPTLANNVETIANIPLVLAEGAEWFREVGTAESPGTIVCTVSGATKHDGVGEFALGTPLREILESVGGGFEPDQRVVAVLSGVANPLLPADLLDTPATYEDLERAGSGLGSAGFIVFDDGTDLAAVAAGVSRFLAVESCGQCTPCKQDGLALADLLQRIAASSASDADLTAVADRVATVADEARCFLAEQHQRVIGSVLRLFPDALRRHLDPATDPVEPAPIVPIVELAGDRFQLDLTQLDKQPDWSFDATDSGKTPVDRLRRVL